MDEITLDVDKVYRSLKSYPIKFDEETHCKMILSIMSLVGKGTVAHFCQAANISESKFYRWINEYPLFRECYELGRMYSRVNWEEEGKSLRHNFDDRTFEHWRLIGWSRFGVGKNQRIRLNLNSEDNPNKHYNQLLKQASNGDFTAGEIKQLMEAVNVGLNAHNAFELQRQIDEIKSDYNKAKEIEAENGQHTKPAKRTEKVNKDTVAD